ncbi:MAG: bifunctional hydroxymethylpyrimidine kinase/phosphomethylpyrimidine kinase [Oscillospiraceae bacterium]|nr:bifunctional hydroxymethylpyrimidine kinase/phosphomethylpyrimidine kinase [Oscillospiraceae bacterium]
MGIVVLGAVFVDIKGYPLDLYIPGGRNAGRVEQVHGGVGRNIAEDIANVELRPTFVSLVDNTGAGRDVLDQLRRHKVNVDYVGVTPNGMGTWLAVFNNDGDVAAAISKRPDLRPVLDILERRGEEIFAAADSVILEIDMEREIVKKVFTLAERYGKEVYAVVSNMSIAVERRDFLRRTACFVCNLQEAGILFSEDFGGVSAAQMTELLPERVKNARIRRMVVTMGGEGAVYADDTGNAGVVPAQRVDVKDTTGAGDAFFSGVAIGLTYGKSLEQACRIGTRLASSVICTAENVCPRFLPEEFDLKITPKGDFSQDTY